MTTGNKRVVRPCRSSGSLDSGGHACAGSGEPGRHAGLAGNCAARSSHAAPARGLRKHGANQFADLGPLESEAVRYLRLWCDGPASQCVVWNEFATRLGPAAGRAALKSFEHLVCMFVHLDRCSHATRSVDCPCLSVHESLLAQLVDAASRGNREGASDAAKRMVGTGRSVALTGRAGSLAAALQDMRCAARSGTTVPRIPTPTIN